jgi:hypothetical protein
MRIIRFLSFVPAVFVGGSGLALFRSSRHLGIGAGIGHVERWGSELHVHDLGQGILQIRKDLFRLRLLLEQT